MREERTTVSTKTVASLMLIVAASTKTDNPSKKRFPLSTKWVDIRAALTKTALSFKKIETFIWSVKVVEKTMLGN